MEKALRILAADGNPEMHDYYRETVSLNGHRLVDSVRTGAELIAQTLALRPDAVVADCHLPDMHADQAVEKITQTMHLPFVYLCCERALDDHPAQSPFVFEHLVKPVRATKLLEAIERAFDAFHVQFGEVE